MKAAWLIAGLSFGDEGKGTFTDSLVRTTGASLVVRYNGGPQAAHHVVLPDGKWHSFHQFGSGTFAGARTHLSRYMLVDPFMLYREADILRQQGLPHPWGRISADPRCLVVTPYHVCMNRLREIHRGSARHGSCGMGIGEAVSDLLSFPEHSLRVGMLNNTRQTRTLLEVSRAIKRAEAEEMGLDETDANVALYLGILRDIHASRQYAARYADLSSLLTLYLDNAILEVTDTVVFEGAQGVLLDETYGLDPHTTWSTTTFANALKLASEVDVEVITRVGVVRSYMTRHGAGPLATEMPAGVAAMAEMHNQVGDWQGDWRVGAFDMPLTRYAVECCKGIDYLAVSHLDKVTPGWPIAVAMKDKGDSLWTGARDYVKVASVDHFQETLTLAFNVPLLTSTGPTHIEKSYPETQWVSSANQPAR